MTSEACWRVIIIDDSPEDRAEIRSLLLQASNRRYNFEEAETAAAGVRAVLSGDPPDLVILDYSLPDMEAPDVLALLTGRDELPVCPVLVLTGWSTEENSRAVLRAGAQDFLGKNWMTSESLTHGVESAMERFQLTRQLRESRRFLHQIASITPGVLYVFDLEKQCTVFINRTVASVLGYNPDEVAAMGTEVVPTLMHSDDLPRFAVHMQRVRRLGNDEIAEFEHRMRDRSGAWHWFLSRDSVFERDADGAVRQLIGTAIEITERKAAEEVSAASAAEFRSLFEMAGVGNAEVEVPSGRFVRVNRRFCELVGYAADELVGKMTFRDITHSDDRERNLTATTLFMQNREGHFEIEKRCVRKDGSTIWAHLTSTLIRGRDGQATRMLGSATDITERKRMEALLDARALQQQALAELGLASIHEADLQKVFDLAVTAVARTFDVELCKVLELLPEGRELFFRAGVGWHDGLVGRAIVGTELESQAGYTLVTDEPVIVEDMRTESRFSGPPLLHEHGVVSGLSCIIAGSKERPWGVLGAHTTLHRRFTNDDVAFLQGVANVLAMSIQRRQTEETLRTSEAFNRTVLESNPDCVKVLDTEGRLQFMNANGLGALEIDDFAGVQGQLWWRLWPEASALMAREAVEKAKRGETVEFQAWGPTAKGTPKWWDVIVAPIYHQKDAGRVDKLISVSRDITEPKQAEAALREIQERMRLATEATAVGIWEWNLLTNRVWWNPQMFLIYGVAPTPDGFVEYSVWSGAVLLEDLPEQERVLQETVRNCGTSRRSFRIRRSGDAAYRHIEAVDTVRLNAQGETEWVVGTNLDVTDRTRQEEELRRWRDALEMRVRERTKELLASQASLRALAAELNLAEQRERKRLAGELHDHLAQLLVLCRLNMGRVKRSGLTTKAEEIINETEEVLNNALAYSRTVMAELSPPVLQEHGLPAGLTWLGAQMQRHGLAVTVDVGQGAEYALSEDRAMLLFQSVRELLMNILKHAQSTDVAIDLKHHGGLLVIEVRDEGVGFDLAAAAAAAGTTTTTALSSKFGLFSIRERMRALGGRFDIESAPGKGTKATLALPVESAGVTVLSPEQVRSEPQHAGLQPHAKARVLLVDDHALVRQGLRSMLESYDDVDVIGEAWNGEEAVACVERLHPSIVVMDINMPKMNGIEATAAIISRYPDIIVIGLSVNAGGATEEAMTNAGAVALLSKEAAVENLYRAIRETMGVKVIREKVN